MSHCTKFDFTYSNERAIVMAFSKLGIKCTTDIVSLHNSDFSKHILGSLGYLGNTQYRAICGVVHPYQLFMCRIEEDRYELLIEKGDTIYENDAVRMNQIEEQFRNAYIEVAIDEIIKKLDKGNMPSKVESQENKYLIHFGPSYEYKLSIVFDNGVLTEEVEGVKGDFCTKLTEDIEDILSHPEAELNTVWKVEREMLVEDQNIQVLELSF